MGVCVCVRVCVIWTKLFAFTMQNRCIRLLQWQLPAQPKLCNWGLVRLCFSSVFHLLTFSLKSAIPVGLLNLLWSGIAAAGLDVLPELLSLDTELSEDDVMTGLKNAGNFAGRASVFGFSSFCYRQNWHLKNFLSVLNCEPHSSAVKRCRFFSQMDGTRRQPAAEETESLPTLMAFSSWPDLPVHTHTHYLIWIRWLHEGSRICFHI